MTKEEYNSYLNRIEDMRDELKETENKLTNKYLADFRKENKDLIGKCFIDIEQGLLYKITDTPIISYNKAGVNMFNEFQFPCVVISKEGIIITTSILIENKRPVNKRLYNLTPKGFDILLINTIKESWAS